MLASGAAADRGGCGGLLTWRGAYRLRKDSHFASVNFLRRFGSRFRQPHFSLTPNLDEQKAAVVAEADRAGRTAARKEVDEFRHRRQTTPATNSRPFGAKSLLIRFRLPCRSRRAQREVSESARTKSRPRSRAQSRHHPARRYFARDARQGLRESSRDDDMLDEQTWSRYCATNLVDPDQLIKPTMRAVIEVEVTPGDEEFKYSSR